MKNKVIKYRLSSKKIDNLSMTVIGDIHTIYTRKSFQKTINEINDLKNDLLLIAGDLTTTGKEWSDPKYLKEIKKTLQALAEAQPVAIIFGNHDLYKLKDEGIRNFKSIDIEDVYPLYNETVELDINEQKIRIDGYVPESDAYITKINDKRRKDNHSEYKIMKREAERIDSFKCLYDNTYNILLNHDPRLMRFSIINDMIDKYDLITGAHMHNGYLPNFLTTKKSNLFDNDYFYLLNKKNTDKKGYCRGTICGTSDEFVFIDQMGNYFYKKNDYYLPINEEEFECIKNKLGKPPLVITGGINKYVGIPIDSQELTKVLVNRI